jgi:hypothetical protein
VTRFNSIVSPYRVFETRRFLLDEFREIRRLVPGAKVNDVVLAVCAGGLRNYLASNDELPEEDLSTLTPVYVRDPAAGPGSKPEVKWVRLMLGVNIADPVKRLAFVRAQTAASEALSRAIGARELTDIGTHAPAATLAIYARCSAALLGAVGAPIANCVITNVPGSAVPIYPTGPHDVLLRDHADQRRARPGFRRDELRRQDHRVAHVLPRADARSGSLCAVRARLLPGVLGLARSGAGEGGCQARR